MEAIVLAIHRDTYATREYQCHEPYVYEKCTAILADGSTEKISSEEFDRLRENGVYPYYFLTEVTGSEGEANNGTPLQEAVNQVFGDNRQQ